MHFGATLGGFTALATISIARISGGLSDDGEQYINSTIEMEGKVVTFSYGSLKETLRQKTKADVYIQIDFKECPEKNWFGCDEKKYIGDIRLREENTEVLAFVNVTLPLSMYPILQSLKREQIKIDTIHEIISNPSDRQKTDNIVAFIKRIHFEIQPVKEDESSRKRSL